MTYTLTLQSGASRKINVRAFVHLLHTARLNGHGWRRVERGYEVTMPTGGVVTLVR